MASQDPHLPAPLSPEGLDESKTRRTIMRLVMIMVAIVLSTGVLLNYPELRNWERIDANLLVFGVVNANIVMLTAVFYMLLRNLFKLFYEQKAPLAAWGLRTKLIIAVVALSLPSTAFHLMTSVFLATRFEAWSVGEYRQVVESAGVVTQELEKHDEQLLRRVAQDVVGGLPHQPAAYAQPGWYQEALPTLDGGFFVYGPNHKILQSWVSTRKVRSLWSRAPDERFNNPAGQYWSEKRDGRRLHRLLLPFGDKATGLWLEVVSTDGHKLEVARERLDYREESARFLRRDLFLMSITLLFVMTLLILFAATWIAFFLARGFATPIEKLAEATRRVSGGELGWEVRERELGPMQRDFVGLVRAFNKMSVQLKDQRDQLVDATQNLRQSHKELGERTRFVELLLDNVEVGILALDTQGLLTTLNKGAQGLLLLRHPPEAGQHFSQVFNREMTRVLTEMLEEMHSTQAMKVVRNLNVPQAGENLHLEVTMLPLGQAQSEGVVVVLEDVTTLQRTQRAEAWREVAKRVAHEIKNPLTPIQLSAQRIRRRYLEGMGQDGAVLDECTDTIIREVTSLKDMVNAFSQFAKLPERKPHPDDLNRVIREVARLYANGLPENIRMTLELEAALPTLPLDTEQMRRVFSNLIDNAASAMPNGGTIVLRTRFLAEQNRIQAQVEDDGLGVPLEIRGRLFEPYATTKAGGTGLGLAICNQIVSDHNGTLHYTDRQPHGALFSLELPLA